MAREAKCLFSGHEIIVRISVMDDPTTKLYIDGKVVDTCKSNVGKGSIVRGSIEKSGTIHIVEVHRRHSFTTPKIFVDGKAQPLVK
jgi:hypothetical protein